MARAFRPTKETHKPHDDCLIAAVAMLIPRSLRMAWKKGLAWRPRCDGWEQSFEHAAESVQQGVRPLLYGFPDEDLATTGLQTLSMRWISVAFRPENRDLAELMAWGHTQEDLILHVVNGVVLGYPLLAVENWINSGCPGPTMREVICRRPAP